MPRRIWVPLAVVGTVLFLILSALLARYLSVDNVERDADLNLLKAEVHGDAGMLIAQISGCAARPACVDLQRSNAARLRRPGAVKILNLQSATANAPVTSSGETRVAWEVAGRLPVVQCVLVRRTGNAISGLSVTLLGLSAPIDSTGSC